jgi:hypothetical protein
MKDGSAEQFYAVKAHNLRRVHRMLAEAADLLYALGTVEWNASGGVDDDLVGLQTAVEAARQTARISAEDVEGLVEYAAGTGR